MSKKTVVVIFGGKSSEHDISCISAANVISSIDKDNYNILIIGITKDGRWLKVNNIDDIKSGKWQESNTTAIISPDASHKGILLINSNKVVVQKVDVAFPVMHGPNGEDGTIQGLFELAGIPYTGCGVVSSGISMDKLFAKLIVNSLGIKQAKYVPVNSSELANIQTVKEKIEAKLEYPVFVKPSNSGSSQGITKAHNFAELSDGLHKAAKHDKKILVEEAITGRELECAVLGAKNPIASGIGEVVSSAEFYDYDSKYNDAASKEIISPKLPNEVEQTIREYALKIFNAVDGYGLSRVDFFLEDKTNEIIFNEINTLPGFTSISMYPMLWEAKGISKTQLVEKIIQSGLRRFE